jgi:hypothetical protein
MTITASRALSLLIQADLNEQLQSCLKAVEETQCDLVGIVVANGWAEVFIADFPGPVEEEIRRFEQRINAMREYTDARYYLCREDRAKAVNRTEFFASFWLRLIERGKKYV